jgi:hypothetical protein
MLLFVAVSLSFWLFGNVLPDWWSAGSTLGSALRIRNEEPFGHSLYAAGAAVLSAPWLAALGLTGPRRWRKHRLIAAALALALVTTTSSRGGAGAVVVMLACVGAIWFRNTAIPRRGRLLMLAGSLTAAALAVALDPRLNDLIVHRRWSSAATESNVQHASMVQAGWLMGCDRPLTGYGPGAVPLVYPRYRARLLGGTDNALQLHNMLAEFWAELGAPGVIALLFVAAGVLKLGFGTMFVSRSSRETTREASVTLPLNPLRAQAAFIALLGYAVFSLFDSQLDVPWFMFTVVGLLVMLRVSLPPSGSEAARAVVPATVGRLAGALLLVGLAAMVWPLPSDLRARQLFWNAANARQAGNDDAFVAGTERAAAMAPENPFYPTQLAAFYGERYVRADTVAGQVIAHDRCRDILRQILRIDRYQDFCHFNLGWLLLAREPAAAEKHFRDSALLSPYRSGVYLGLGLSLLGRDEGAAATAFALEWANDPVSMSSPRWDPPKISFWRGRIGDALQHLAASWLEREGLSEHEKARIRYVAALADWWAGRKADVAILARGGSPEQRRFFQNLDAMERRTYMPVNPGALEPWEQLYLDWRDGTVPASLEAQQPAFAAALRKEIVQHRDSFSRLLTCSTDGEPGLVRWGRNERPGYSIMARNQDGFLLRDLYIYPENILAEDYASFLFPQKGYLADRLLLNAMSQIAPKP